MTSSLEKLLQEIEELGDYDLHNILRRRRKVEWCEWHLNIDKNDNAIRIAERFHQEIKKKLKASSSLTDEINTVERTFLELLSNGHNDWKEIRNCFKQARADDSPVPIIKAYTLAQKFTTRLQLHSAVNTHHALELYCTLLNCPVLAQTQEYTEAFTRILFHPKLDDFLVHRMKVYRGAVIKNKTLVANYKEGATIITTAFLSTSQDPAVAKAFSAVPPENMNDISLFSIYNINNVIRRTAIDVGKMSNFEDEGEIIILRYVPFTIRSVEQTEGARKMTVYFDECPEKCIVEENRF
jgi:hypothetical protein